MRVRYSNILISSTFALFATNSAMADVPLGLWETSPDRSGLVFHVRTKPCGGSLCGQIERAKNRHGYDTPSTTVGRRLLWDMRAQDDGSYQGQIWEPAANRMLMAKMRVNGNRMQFQNCDEALCEDIIWVRLR
jgi:uncharacterized protein (DUF2147 family)